MAEELANLDATIFVLEKMCSNGGEKTLATLYRELRTAKSPRLFQAIAGQMTECLRSSSCDINICYSHWVIICGMLFECFYRHFEDSGTVAEVLRCIENHFNPKNFFFNKTAVLRLKLPSSVIEDRRSKGLKSFDFLAYFLHHANQSRLTVNGERYVSKLGLIQPYYPIFNSAKKVPRSVFTLLQYGGRLSDKKKICINYVPDILAMALRAVIECRSELQQWDRNTLSFQVKLPQVNYTMKNMCNCFCALLQDTMNPQEATFLLAGRDVDGFRIPELETLLPIYDQLFPGHLYGRRTPSPLRHMCRYVIRNTLFDNWNLPDGIQSLPIPEMIMDYLNLLYD